MRTENKFVVKFNDGQYLADTSGCASELLSDAHIFETKESAQTEADDYEGTSVAGVVVTYATNWYRVGKYNQRGSLRGTWNGFAWTTWSNHFETEAEAQEKADQLNEDNGIEVDNHPETIYAVQEMEDDAIKSVKLA